jgi:hypothetical protein
MINVSDALPWDEYRRSRLRSGMSYPVGRNLIERSLREAGVTIGSLDFAVPAAGPAVSPEDQDVIEVFWFGKSRSRQLANASLAPADALFMRVWAVHSTCRHESLSSTRRRITDRVPVDGRRIGPRTGLRVVCLEPRVDHAL